VRVKLHQRASGSGRLVLDFKDAAARDGLIGAITAALKAGDSPAD
jgi:hypothetical protein